MKLEINNRKKTAKFTSMRKLNALLRSNISGKESQGKLGNALRQMTMKKQHIKLWDAVKALFKGIFIAANIFIKKEISSIYNLTLHVKK